MIAQMLLCLQVNEFTIFAIFSNLFSACVVCLLFFLNPNWLSKNSPVCSISFFNLASIRRSNSFSSASTKHCGLCKLKSWVRLFLSGIRTSFAVYDSVGKKPLRARMLYIFNTYSGHILNIFLASALVPFLAQLFSSL